MSSTGRVVSFAALAAAVPATAPKLGATRLVCIDGPAGSGKTTLAETLSPHLGDVVGQPVPVVHMDDLYEGWDEPLDAAARRLREQVLAPVRAGVPGRYQRYDWHAGAFAEWHEVSAGPVLVVEGVGSAPRETAAETSLLVWVDALADVRLQRGVERDGEALRGQWVAWLAKEQRWFAAQATAERADLVVAGDATETSAGQVVVLRGWPLRHR